MSIATEIDRIRADRNTIRAKLVELGLANNTDTLDALATAIEGMINRGAVSVEILEGATYTIPAGYHNGSGVVKAMTDTAGEAEKYKTQAKTVTPTKKQQSIAPDAGYYALESVTVSAIPDMYQDVTPVTAEVSYVLTGKVFVAADGTVKTGTMPDIGAVDETLSVTKPYYNIPRGYHYNNGKVKLVLDEKVVTPTKSTQIISPDSGKVLGAVEVKPIPAAYQDITVVTATPETVLAGSKFVDSSGATKTGAMTNQGAVNATIDGLISTSCPIPIGYHNGQGKISLTSSIEDALAEV